MEMKEYYSLSLEETIAASILRTYTEACHFEDPTRTNDLLPTECCNPP